MSPKPTEENDQSTLEVFFDNHVEQEAQIKQAYGDDQLEKVLKFNESLLKCEWEAYNEKVKLLEPVYKQRSEFIKKIPGFWLKVLTNDPRCSNHIDPIDRDALAHLEDLTIEHDPKDPRNVTFHFHFAKGNPYFSDRILSKKFAVPEAVDPSTAANGSAPKAHPLLAEMERKYGLDFELKSTPVAINWASDEHNLVAKKPFAPQDLNIDEDEPDLTAGFGSFFNFFSFKDDHFELQTLFLEVHAKALDIYAGILDSMGGYGGLSDDEEDDEEDEDPNQVYDLELDSTDEPKKKKAKVAP